MEQFSIRRKAQRVTRFVIVQFIALLGWIFVQLFFSISSIGRTVPFGVVLVIEAIWWMGLLLIMLLLFLNEFSRFVQAAIDMEEANNSLRRRVNALLGHARDASMTSMDHARSGQSEDERWPQEREVTQQEDRGNGQDEDGTRTEPGESAQTVRLNRESKQQREARRQECMRGKDRTGQEEDRQA